MNSTNVKINLIGLCGALWDKFHQGRLESIAHLPTLEFVWRVVYRHPSLKLELTMLTELSSSLVLWAGGVAVAVLVVQAYRRHSRNVRVVGNVPGLRTVASITHPSVMIIPHLCIPYSTWLFSIGPNWWMNKGYESQSLGHCRLCSLAHVL